MKLKCIALVCAFLAVAAVSVWRAGEVLSAPARSAVGPPPSTLNASRVVFEAPGGQSVSGWFAEGRPGLGAVLLLHGVRSDRRQMVDRAVSLHASGYGVLLIDLPSHSESTGDRITFGYREADGVRASLRYLSKNAGGERTAVVGVSLGAAAFSGRRRDAAERCGTRIDVPTIDEAIRDRLRLRAGSVGASFAPLLLTQIPMRLGISADHLRPIDHSGAAPRAGAGRASRKPRTTVDETRRIFETANAPKELWLVEGAGHVDLYDFNPREYEQRVFGFLGGSQPIKQTNQRMQPTATCLWDDPGSEAPRLMRSSSGRQGSYATCSRL